MKSFLGGNGFDSNGPESYKECNWTLSLKILSHMNIEYVTSRVTEWCADKKFVTYVKVNLSLTRNKVTFLYWVFHYIYNVILLDT